jgi:hypothetical protein
MRSSHQTPRWSKPDSNSRSHPDGKLGLRAMMSIYRGGVKRILKVPRLSPLLLLLLLGRPFMEPRRFLLRRSKSETMIVTATGIRGLSVLRPRQPLARQVPERLAQICFIDEHFTATDINRAAIQPCRSTVVIRGRIWRPPLPRIETREGSSAYR